MQIFVKTLTGKTDIVFRADLTFACQAKSFARLAEGFYHNGKPPPSASAPPTELDIAADDEKDDDESEDSTDEDSAEKDKGEAASIKSMTDYMIEIAKDMQFKTLYALV